MDIDVILEEYISLRMLADATKTTYRKVVRIFIDDTTITSISDIDEKALIDWRNLVVSRASTTTWNTYYRHLKALTRFAFKRKYILEDPFDFVTSAPAVSKKKKTVKPEQLHFIINELTTSNKIENGWFWSALIKTLYYTGMRRRQCTELRWKHINFNANEITLVSETSKTRRSWSIPLDPRLKNDLLVLRRESRKLKSFDDYSDCQVFNITIFKSNRKNQWSDHSTEMNADYLSKKLIKIGKTFSVKLSPLRLRHTLGTEIANGMTNNSEIPFGIKALQQQMGHTNISTTLGYVHPSIKEQREIVGVLKSI